MSAILNARYYYAPHLTSMLLPYNLLGNMGPTIVKPVLCLDLDPWASAHGSSGWDLFCLVEVFPLFPSPYKILNLWCDIMMSGEAGWIVGSTHQHHVLGTSQVMAHTLLYTPLGRCRLNWEN